MKRFLLVLFLSMFIVLSGCNEENIIKPVEGQTAQVFTYEQSESIELGYLLSLPENYSDSKKKFPLMLFLHGVGERGTDVNKVKLHGPPRLIAEGKDYDFIVVSPQCPPDKWWNDVSDGLNKLVDNIVANYNVDPDRLYITGLSMGGFGTWDMITKYPDKFAAAAPICGGGNSYLAKERLGKLPIWVFHGAKDGTVSIDKSKEMVEALKANGNSNYKFTIYPEAGHDAWTETYNNPELYEWMLLYKK